MLIRIVTALVVLCGFNATSHLHPALSAVQAPQGGPLNVQNANFGNGETGWQFVNGVLRTPANGNMSLGQPSSGGAGAAMRQTIAHASAVNAAYELNFVASNSSAVTRTFSMTLRSASENTGQISCGFTLLPNVPRAQFAALGRLGVAASHVMIEIAPTTSDGSTALVIDDVAVISLDTLATSSCYQQNIVPSQPQPISPLAGARTTQTVTLSANASVDPDVFPNSELGYRFEIERVGGGWSDARDWASGRSASFILPGDGLYRWQVLAGDGDGASDPNWIQFRVGNPKVFLPAVTR